MKKTLFVTLTLCLSQLMMAAKFNNFVNLNVANKARKYLLYVPSNVKENAPLVLSLHGAGGTVTTTTHDPNFHSVADTEGFIVAYPQGSDVPAVSRAHFLSNCVKISVLKFIILFPPYIRTARPGKHLA